MSHLDASRSLVAVFTICLSPFAGCPATVPSPVPPTRTAWDVEADLETHHCAPDGGLPALEQAHARYDRDPRLDCLFAAGGSVGKCGCLP